MSHDDFEAIPGLPEPLPAGERLLWQGTPRWQTLARGAFHLRLVSVYLGLMVLLRAAWLASEGASLDAVAAAAASSASLSLIAIGMLAALAWLSAGATIYTVTNRRVAIRHGIALGLTLNVPFSVIESAAVKEDVDGSGQITLCLHRGTRIGYLLNWPHVRPGRFTHPEPMLRALPSVAAAAAIVAGALADSARAGGSGVATSRPTSTAIRLPNTAAA